MANDLCLLNMVLQSKASFAICTANEIIDNAYENSEVGVSEVHCISNEVLNAIRHDPQTF